MVHAFINLQANKLIKFLGNKEFRNYEFLRHNTFIAFQRQNNMVEWREWEKVWYRTPLHSEQFYTRKQNEISNKTNSRTNIYFVVRDERASVSFLAILKFVQTKILVPNGFLVYYLKTIASTNLIKVPFPYLMWVFVLFCALMTHMVLFK